MRDRSSSRVLLVVTNGVGGAAHRGLDRSVIDRAPEGPLERPAAQRQRRALGERRGAQPCAPTRECTTELDRSLLAPDQADQLVGASRPLATDAGTLRAAHVGSDAGSSAADPTSAGQGKTVFVRVVPGGTRIIK